MIQIGNKLKILRTSRGFSSEEVAEKLGISKSTYVRYERNETVPNLNFFESISNLYQIGIADFFTEEKLVFNNNNQSGGNYYAHYVEMSEKLIEQFEKRIADKEMIIESLQEKIRLLESEK